MTLLDLPQLLDDTAVITQRAGETIMSFYQGAFDVAEKTPDNPVTEADYAADTLLRQQLGQLLPAAGWLSEETVDSPDRLDRSLVWVVDPLDGTKEFVMGIPEFSISVALVQDGLPILAVVFSPATAELYTAYQGGGLQLNGSPATVTPRTQLAGSLVDASRSERQRGEFAPFEELLELNTIGSIAYKLARTAAGQADATWSRGPKHEWDVCAGVLLVQEGGGICVDLDDQPFRFNKPWPKVNGILADNGHLHPAVVEALAPHRETARTD